MAAGEMDDLAVVGAGPLRHARACTGNSTAMPQLSLFARPHRA
jgi:hypothetical protein